MLMATDGIGSTFKRFTRTFKPSAVRMSFSDASVRQYLRCRACILAVNSSKSAKMHS